MRQSFFKYRFYIVLLALAALNSCSVKKYIPEGEYLFRGGKIIVQDSVKIKDKSGLEGEQVGS